MQAFSRGAAALALIAAPLSAQSDQGRGDKAAEIDEAVHCAAVQTFVAAMVAEGDEPNVELEENLQNSTVRWLEYASALSPDGEGEVMNRYTTESEALIGQLGSEGFDVDAFTETLTQDALACVASEKATFGDSDKDE